MATAQQAKKDFTHISKVLPKVEARSYATGRRKTAAARVWISKGKGRIFVNGLPLDTYFVSPILRMVINQPFTTTNSVDMYDVYCTVKGSGTTGQAGAIRHGISRALDKDNNEFHDALHHKGLLTRDPRKVERKKYGLKKVRKRFQFSKR